MNKLTLSEVTEKFMNYNKENNISYSSNNTIEPLQAIIVYKESNWKNKYSLEQRSYRINSERGKRFFADMGGNSMWGDCLDGVDMGVRLDTYNWAIDYCYMVE